MEYEPGTGVGEEERPSFGALLRRYRLAAGLTQDALAERAQLSVHGIADQERGARHFPYVGTVERLAQALELTAAERAALTASARRPPGRVGETAVAPHHRGGSALAPLVGRHPDEPPSFGPRRRHNLPSHQPTLIGREEAVTTVRERLRQAETGLLTLTGAGGSGKTTLAVAVGETLLDHFPDGVWLVEMAPLCDPDLIASAIAARLGVREQPGRLIGHTLLKALGHCSLLLILDNCEHLLEACAELVNSLLQAAPGVRVLATSREALGIRGERLYRVPLLAAPEPDARLSLEQLAAYPAIELFVARAQLVQSDFALTSANRNDVAHVCYRLDGMPLAIELAAARVGVLTVHQVRARLDDCFRLLVGGSRVGLPRQRTLEATLDWSYQLLAPVERVLLRRLSVFSGGWTLEAAEQVCSGEDLARGDVLNVLSRLVDKSLVVAEEQGGAMRYRLLETVRQYALQQLAAGSDQEPTRRAHAVFFLDFAEVAEQELMRPSQAAWLERLEHEHDNLRGALAWVTSTGRVQLGVRLAGALYGFWELHGHLSEGRQWLERLLAPATNGSDAPTALFIKALRGAGVLAWQQGDHPRAKALHEEGLALARKLGDREAIALQLTNLAVVAREQGDSEHAIALNGESLAIARELGNKQAIALALNNIAVLATDTGECERASELLKESLILERDIGDTWGIALALNSLGVLANDQAKFGLATELLEECLALRRDLGDKRGSEGWRLPWRDRCHCWCGASSRAGGRAVRCSERTPRIDWSFTGAARAPDPG